ncbi:MAG: replicative DNA helicase [Candidatus Aminicenantes bacterium RBG_13_62_12]|nr:MAG: replicative DNA helicase [Candidatus Aminicenantes bacterium RBG_13_62_12]
MELDLTFLKKAPPHSLEAERSILGGILVNNQNLSVVLSVIGPEDFYREAHRQILDRIILLVDKGLPVDLLSLTEALRRDGLLEEAGGASYLASLMDGVPRSLNVGYHAQVVKEKALLRRLIASSMKIVTSSYEEHDEPDAILDEAQSAIIDVAEQRTKTGFIPMGQLVPATLETLEVMSKRRDFITGVPSGFTDLDRITSGFHRGEFVVVAARPSMGKTALCLNIAEHVGLRTPQAVGFFSMEMSLEQLTIRMLCADAKVDLQKIRMGLISGRDMEKIKLSAEVLAPARIYLDETPGLTVLEMKAKARRLKMEGNLDILFVDYMQLMRTSQRFENRNQEMSFISRSMKELAKELQIPVVGISQLSRAPEKGRKEPRPILSDLRESGAIEQDADVVIFIYRPEVYIKADEAEKAKMKGLAEVDVAKQRNGPTDTAQLVFFDRYTLFANKERSAAEE